MPELAKLSLDKCRRPLFRMKVVPGICEIGNSWLLNRDQIIKHGWRKNLMVTNLLLNYSYFVLLHPYLFTYYYYTFGI